MMSEAQKEAQRTLRALYRKILGSLPKRAPTALGLLSWEVNHGREVPTDLLVHLQRHVRGHRHDWMAALVDRRRGFQRPVWPVVDGTVCPDCGALILGYRAVHPTQFDSVQLSGEPCCSFMPEEGQMQDPREWAREDNLRLAHPRHPSDW